MTHLTPAWDVRSPRVLGDCCPRSASDSLGGNEALMLPGRDKLAPDREGVNLFFLNPGEFRFYRLGIPSRPQDEHGVENVGGLLRGAA